VSVALCLLLYAVLVATTAPLLLPYLTRAGRAPRAAIAAWLLVLASVAAAWTAGGIGLAVDAAEHWGRPEPMGLSACLARVLSTTAHTGLIIEATLAATALTLVGVVVTRVARLMRGARTQGRRHAATARMVGHHLADIDSVRIDAPDKIVYCVGGQTGVTVVTSAALDALTRPELLAVLAHERAHVDGGHHALLTATRALSAAMPRTALVTVAHAQIAQLVEMCADDTAAHRHGTPVLLQAMLALAGAGPLPLGALGANGIGLADRITRLNQPGTAVQCWRSRIALAASAGALLAAPPWLAGLGTCALMLS
jgi:Zn-dependent protease with chaperone function